MLRLYTLLLIACHRLRPCGASYHQAYNASHYKSMLHVVLRYALFFCRRRTAPLWTRCHPASYKRGPYGFIDERLEKAIGRELLAAAVAADECEDFSELGVIRQANGAPDSAGRHNKRVVLKATCGDLLSRQRVKSAVGLL